MYYKVLTSRSRNINVYTFSHVGSDRWANQGRSQIVGDLRFFLTGSSSTIVSAANIAMARKAISSLTLDMTELFLFGGGSTFPIQGLATCYYSMGYTDLGQRLYF